MASQIATHPRPTSTTTAPETRPAPGVSIRQEASRRTPAPETPLGGQEASTIHSASATTTFAPSNIRFAGIALAGAAALFTAGLIRRHAMPVLRDLAYDAFEIKVPVLLPVTVAALALEILAAKRAMTWTSNGDAPHPAR